MYASYQMRVHYKSNRPRKHCFDWLIRTINELHVTSTHTPKNKKKQNKTKKQKNKREGKKKGKRKEIRQNFFLIFFND